MKYLGTSQVLHIVRVIFYSAIIICMDELVRQNKIHLILAADCILT